MTIGRLVTSNIRLVRLIGKGGMGTVWSATNLTLGAPVAVKMLDRAYITDDKSVARFKQEAQRAARIRSPHITVVYDYGVTTTDEPYIVMELLEGETLGRCIKRCGPLPPEDVAQIIEQTARGLASAHAQGVVHRDIKPDNLFLVENHDSLFIKILDFGIAKQMDAPPDFTMKTTTGLMVGTPAYMSPEQYVDPKIIGLRTDLWSLGVVTYEALTGVRPFQAQNMFQLARAITEKPFTPPTQVQHDLPEAIDEWMQKALAKKPEDRFSTAREMAESLSAILIPGPRPIRPSTLPPKPGSVSDMPAVVYVPPPITPDKPFITTEDAPPPSIGQFIDDRLSSVPPEHAAKRSDINAPPFPTERSPLVVARTFDAAMVARIELGYVPRSENDKWFVFTEHNRVFFHRSQTADPVYEVILEPASRGRKRVAQAWVAANKKAMQNANLLARLFDELFGEDPMGSPLSARGEALYPFQRIWIHEGDLKTLTVDALVNSADPSLLGGPGLDGELHRAAGAGLLAECRALGKCAVGEAKITKGHSLPVKHVIHTVGPTWRGGLLSERRKLEACYANSLALAANANLRTVAFPSISTGTKHFPLDEAAFIAAKTTLEFFARRTSVELVIFCTFSPAHTRAAREGLAQAAGR